MTLDYDVRPDGQYTATMHIERRAGTEAAARSLATFPWRYSPSHEHVTIVAAFTRKADGREVPVDLATVRDSVPDPSQNLASFTDRREKVIPFPGLVAGDSIVVEIRDQVIHPLLPGVFSLALVFDQTQAWDDVTVNVTMPGSLKLLSDAVGPHASAVGDGAIVTYAWRYHDTDILPAASCIARADRAVATPVGDHRDRLAADRPRLCGDRHAAGGGDAAGAADRRHRDRRHHRSSRDGRSPVRLGQAQYRLYCVAVGRRQSYAAYRRTRC